MGVSSEVWRARIRGFSMPPSKQSRKAGIITEWFDDGSIRPAFVAVIVMAFLLSHQLLIHFGPSQEFQEHPLHEMFSGGHTSAHPQAEEPTPFPYFRQLLLLSGDVESNPGPDTSLTSKQLQEVQSSLAVSNKPARLLNKHIFQLFQLKTSCSKHGLM